VLKNVYPRGEADAIGRMENPRPAAPADADDARLDKWLWMVRAHKTRALAAEACRLGRVTVDGREAKPAHTIRAGQLVEVRDGLVRRKLAVLGVPRGRQGAARVSEFMRDETPPEMLAAAREQRVQHVLAGGGGRPTKKDRRARDALRERQDET
jgi:ribosome-associated heat shock protein Hsp15